MATAHLWLCKRMSLCCAYMTIKNRWTMELLKKQKAGLVDWGERKYCKTLKHKTSRRKGHNPLNLEWSFPVGPIYGIQCCPLVLGSFLHFSIITEHCSYFFSIWLNWILGRGFVGVWSRGLVDRGYKGLRIIWGGFVAVFDCEGIVIEPNFTPAGIDVVFPIWIHNNISRSFVCLTLYSSLLASVVVQHVDRIGHPTRHREQRVVVSGDRHEDATVIILKQHLCFTVCQLRDWTQYIPSSWPRSSI